MPKAKFETWQNYDRQSAIFANGITSGSTDTTGSLVINYTLSTAPRTFVVTNVGTTPYFYTITNSTASGSTVRCFSSASSAIVSTGVTASWLAFV